MAKLFHLTDTLESPETFALELEINKNYQLFQSPETDGLAQTEF